MQNTLKNMSITYKASIYNNRQDFILFLGIFCFLSINICHNIYINQQRSNLMNQPNKSSPYNENNGFLLSFANHPLVTEVMNNGGLGYLNDLRDIQTDNFSNDDKASIIAQIFLADIIADNFNKPINSNNPITTYVSDFSVLESNEPVYWWFAEQPVLWATDSDSRKSAHIGLI